MNIVKKTVLNMIFSELKKCLLEDRILKIEIAVDKNKPVGGFSQQIYVEGSGINKTSTFYIQGHRKFIKELRGWLDQTSFKYKVVKKCRL